MKAVILCGGKGLRMGGQGNIAKPLVQVGRMPVLWHIMKIYKEYGISEFIFCLGHHAQAIKEYFLNLNWRNGDFRLVDGEIRYINEPEKWSITFADTGLDTMTGGRIKAIQKYIEEEEFMLTYGDGLSDVNIKALLEFHRRKGKLATVTGVRQRSGWGILEEEAGIATGFREKPLLDGWVNGGFFVLNRRVFDYIPGDCTWEEEPMKQLVMDRQLAVYPHLGFWHALDTVKDVQELNDLWARKIRPWGRWTNE